MITIKFNFNLLFLKNLIFNNLVGKKTCKLLVCIYKNDTQSFKKNILLKYFCEGLKLILLKSLLKNNKFYNKINNFYYN